MKTANPTPTARGHAGPWLAGAATLALAACAPYPVYDAPRAQAPVQQQVYTYPNAPPDTRDYYRRRTDERLYEATVTSVRSVVATSGQRCWIEREPVSQRSDANVPGAVAGAVIGGILGHQIGGGSGRDIATVGGVVVGGVVGSRIGRDAAGNQVYTQDVQRCTSDATQGQPAYWDVTYTFQGLSHRVQMTSPPGRTITVNANGEPRS